MHLIHSPDPRLSRFFGFLIVMMLSFTMGCSSMPDITSSDEDSLSGTDKQLFVGDMGVEKNYDPNVIMKRAETFFEQEAYPEAIVEYQHFLDLHQAHTLASYAQYRLAMSHFKMIKTIDRDPEPIHQAVDHFRKLLDKFAGSRYAEEARAKIEECRTKLAKRHLMVGEFYYRREAYLAAAHRFEKVLEEFPEREVAADALFHLAQTYQIMGADEWAEQNLVRLLNEHPQHDDLDESLEMLASLNGGKPYIRESDVRYAAADAPATQQEQEPASQPVFTASLNGSAPHPNGSSPQAVNGHGPADNGSSPAINGTVTPVAHHLPYSVVCTVGEWCETPASFQNGSSPSHAVPQATTTCKMGEWC